MKIAEFTDWVNGRWAVQNGGDSYMHNLTISSLGLAGETGEVIEHFKKHIRDGAPLIGNNKLYLELGDVLHYWVRLCHYAGIDPEEVMAMNKAKLLARDMAAGAPK